MPENSKFFTKNHDHEMRQRVLGLLIGQSLLVIAIVAAVVIVKAVAM